MTIKIAVASNDWSQVAGHAGQVRRWIMFEAQQGQTPVKVQRLEFVREQVSTIIARATIRRC